MNRSIFVAIFLSVSLGVVSCKTKSEIRREQELERLKQEVSQVRGAKADSEVIAEELKTEMTRLGNATEEVRQLTQKQYDDLRQELTTLTARIQALEQRAVAEEIRPPAVPEKPSASGYEAGKKFFEEGKYEEAIEALRPATKAKKGDEARKAHFLLAESCFAAKDFASAALEFSEYRKKYPKDALIPNAIYRQANSFRSMGKATEAKLFYQELVEKFPKHKLTAKAKSEMKKLK